MVQYLEKILKEKTEGSQSEILYIQWGYDKKVIPAALQMVSNLFPHYSLHDESHSATIISNIVRVLGRESISNLPAIDIWLLLEAAYGHDLGMVVSGREIEKTFSSEKFINFFHSLLKDETHSLHEFARKFEIKQDKIHFRGKVDLGVNDGIRFILAEHFRVIHAERSREIIKDPLKELDIRSPRGIISARLFNVLGDICAVHTRSFEEVMSLPKSELGLDDEEAHPRFVACMLRIGDLLDLDNNRFSEVMLRTLSALPLDTIHHKSKHLSIESFRVDNDEIFVSAKCEDYDVANVTQHWFDYINSEIRSQVLSWKEIAPPGVKSLPKIRSLPVNLVGYEYIDGKEKPQFTVDTEKALKLLQGAGIYKEKYQAIREVLQNAVDATMIRLWLENEGVLRSCTPQDERFKEIAKRYPITVIIKEVPSDNEYKEWEVSIKDCGFGISKKSLVYLKNTGSSNRNNEKNAVIEKMPPWLRPSGIFGIGFQSIFLLTDQVNLTTKCLSDGNSLSIELNGPNSKKRGSIFLKKLDYDYRQNIGTTLTFVFKSEKIPSVYSYSGGEKNIATKMVKEFDAFSGKTLDVEVGHIVDQVFGFRSKCEIPINIEFNESKYSPNDKTENFSFYDPKCFIELNIYPGGLTEYDFDSVSIFYKNQPVSNNLFRHFINLEINIHGDVASDVLELSRDQILDSYQNKLESYLWDSVLEYVTNKFDLIFKNDKEKTLGSMYLKYYHGKHLKDHKYNQWEEFQVTDYSTGQQVNLKKCLENSAHLRLIENHGHSYRLHSYEEEKISIDNDGAVSLILGTGPQSSQHAFICRLASEYFGEITSFEKNDEQTITTYSKASKNNDFPIELISYALEKHLKQQHQNRAFIPCHAKYEFLRLRDEFSISHVTFIHIDDYLEIERPWMLSPFMLKKVGNQVLLVKELHQNVIDWVYRNRFDNNTTLEQIRSNYDEFCSSINLVAINHQNL